MLSVLLALSLWTAFGVTQRVNLSIPTDPEIGRSDQHEDGPVRLGAEVELKEDSKGSEDAPLDELDVLLDRGLLAPTTSMSRRGWQIEVRSLVSERVRAGHGARGPPQA